MRSDCTFTFVGEVTRRTAAAGESLNPNHRCLQHRNTCFPRLTIVQRLDLVLVYPFFQPCRFVLRILIILDFYKSIVVYLDFMAFLEMLVNPFQRQRILAFNTNGQVMIAVVSEILTKYILLVDIHYKISCNL